jgi:hypothetical protein
MEAGKCPFTDEKQGVHKRIIQKILKRMEKKHVSASTVYVRMCAPTHTYVHKNTQHTHTPYTPHKHTHTQNVQTEELNYKKYVPLITSASMK